MKRSIIIPREVLLVEIERRCALDKECNARNRLGLTKEEARAYCGFTCERCERWNDDVLAEKDAPEWWEELAVTGLEGLRARRKLAADEPGEVIKRLSDNYQAEAGGQKLTDDAEPSANLSPQASDFSYE
ncbi:MAG: hypothetical protein QOF02_1753 [Blastocatellia bacterium]|jgi:hypothetical protein|nr:hypothetical protein [Blastocatellia bacterium]